MADKSLPVILSPSSHSLKSYFPKYFVKFGDQWLLHFQLYGGDTEHRSHECELPSRTEGVRSVRKNPLPWWSQCQTTRPELRTQVSSHLEASHTPAGLQLTKMSRTHLRRAGIRHRLDCVPGFWPNKLCPVVWLPWLSWRQVSLQRSGNLPLWKHSH
jgi:hypothetical protein